MSLEIERRFLVTGAGWRPLILRSQRFCDGLAPYGSGKVRVRIGETSAAIAFKGPREGISRLELEYPIPVQDAEQLFCTLQPKRLVLKTRHWVPVHDAMWFVDVHESPFTGLITAEIELDDEAQRVVLPSWVGEELTGRPTEAAFQMSQNALVARIV